MWWTTRSDFDRVQRMAVERGTRSRSGRLWRACKGVQALAPPGFRKKIWEEVFSLSIFITWPSSGYTPVGPEYPHMLSYPCLLITTWQLVKVYWVTRNEPKIYVICYITISNMKQKYQEETKSVCSRRPSFRCSDNWIWCAKLLIMWA